MAQPKKEESSKSSVLAMIGMCMAVVGAGVRGYQLWQKHVSSRPPASQSPAPVSPSTSLSPEHASRLQPSAVPHASTQPAARLASINVLAEDGTSDLQALFLQSQFSEAQRKALGISTLASGSDLYAVRVRLENTGTIPIYVYPRNIRVHHGSQAVAVYTIEHPSFLQTAVLEPNHFLSGLVVYRATLEVGAAIRLRGEGSYSYEDPSLLVTYGSGSR